MAGAFGQLQSWNKTGVNRALEIENCVKIMQLGFTSDWKCAFADGELQSFGDVTEIPDFEWGVVFDGVYSTSVDLETPTSNGIARNTDKHCFFIAFVSCALGFLCRHCYNAVENHGGRGYGSFRVLRLMDEAFQIIWIFKF